MSATRKAPSTRPQVTKRIKRTNTHRERNSVRAALSQGAWDELVQSQHKTLRPSWR